MKRKLNRVVLIDDDLLTNKINTRIIEKLELSEEIVAFQNAKLALAYLQEKLPSGEFPQPDLIFLDINMPIMNGWEFLDAYQHIKPEQKANQILMMLTSSPSPEDQQKAQQYQIVNGYLEKPLRIDMVLDVIIKYFPDLQK